jgi:hypothetical protein
VSLITLLIGYGWIRHLLPTLLHPPRSPTLSSLHPQPPPAVPAHRLRAATWMNGRTALGAAVVLLAVLAGALFLDRAQRLVPVYAAARDLPAGIPLESGDLMAVPGQVLTAPVRREALVPAELVLASSREAGLVELPVQVDPGDMAQGLRPGDRVQVLAAFTEGARRGRAVVLLPAAEVVQVLEDPAGLAGTGRERGVQLRIPGDRAPVVAAAIATARIFVVKAPGLATDPGAAETPPSGAQEPGPGTDPSGSGDGPAGAGPDDGPAGGASPDTVPPESSSSEPGSPTTSPPGTSASGGVRR